jgi:hypothetical protein
LDSGILTTAYTAVDLQFGTTYEFRVESRNSYSYSGYSDVITLYCGFKPEPPTVVTTSNVHDQVLFEWNEPVNNGATIIGY